MIHYFYIKGHVIRNDYYITILQIFPVTLTK